MFQVGDKVLYPMHGAGVIEGIVEKEVLGQKHHYYVINMLVGSMKTMIPLEKAGDLCIRSIVDTPTMREVSFVFREEETSDTLQSLTWKERCKTYTEKLKDGDIYRCAEVIRDIMCWKKEHRLNSSEVKILETARKIFISELMLVNNIPEEEAAHLIDHPSE